jgi:hypothetical protein
MRVALESEKDEYVVRASQALSFDMRDALWNSFRAPQGSSSVAKQTALLKRKTAVEAFDNLTRYHDAYMKTF